jgi:hypothetical protein
MPSVRSIILVAALVFALSIVIGTLSMLRPPDSGGMGRDTFGTRASGYRAVYELLDELAIGVKRRLPPPTVETPTDNTLVFLAPHRNLVGVEPAFLKAIADWVNRGGRIVVAPAAIEYDEFASEWGSDEPSDPPPDVLGVLGVTGVIIAPFYFAEENGEENNGSMSGPGRWNNSREAAPHERDLPEAILDAWTEDLAPIHSISVEAKGSLAALAGVIDRLAVPGDTVNTVQSLSDEPAGTISFTDAEGVEHHLVAHIPRREGEIIVVGDAALLTNRFIAEADNSVLAVHLFAPAGERVVFDEFYHGLAVRGNPLYLLTRPGYAAMAVALLLAVGLWTWREAVFLGPPLTDAVTRRRDIGEYIDAMARFFRRGRTSRVFLLREVRDGVLNHVCQQVGLAPEVHDKDAVIAALARRDPARAARLAKALEEVDDKLAHPQHWGERQTLHAMQGITACL